MTDITTCTITTPSTPATPRTYDVGQTQAFVAQADSYNTSIHYQVQSSLDNSTAWTNLTGTANNGTTNPSTSFTYTASVSIYVRVIMWDASVAHGSFANAVVSAGFHMIVNDALVLTSTPANQSVSTTIMMTETVHITTNETGGTSTFSYAWYSCSDIGGDDQATLSITTSYINYTPTAVGTYYLKCIITDSATTNATSFIVVRVVVSSLVTVFATSTGYLGLIAKAVS